MMQEQLPITLNSCGIFDNDEKTQAAIFVKMEAWFNFQALTLNWYSDESNIHTFHVVFMSDTASDRLEIENPTQWHVSQLEKTNIILRHDNANTEIKLVIHSDDLKQMMEGKVPVAPFFQNLALSVINTQAIAKQLPTLPKP